MENLGSLIAMIISETLILMTIEFIISSQKNKSQLKKSMLYFLVCMFIWTFGSILQILLQNSPIEPIFFEKISGVGVFFSSVSFLALGVTFAKTKIKIKKYHYLLLIIPLISTILMFTNDIHHLMFEKYSISATEVVYGKYMTVHLIYTYLLFGIGLVYFLKYSIKNSGFFSKQSLLIILGTSIPLVLNFLGAFNIMPLTTYTTPISFSFMVLIYSLAIFKFDFMKVTPIALQRIVDRISDGYIVLNEENRVIDFNDTLLKMFSVNSSTVRNMDLFDLIKKKHYFKIDINVLKKSIIKATKSDDTFYFEKKFEKSEKYLNIEINSIKSKGTFLGVLILFKDTTQHMIDMQTIRNNQEMLMEKERLASLGQLIGGIAHNLKTPIMSISGATEGLNDLIKEYDTSIEDSDVSYKDHHDIANDMSAWIKKIKSYTEYMSDVITAVKGQAVTLSDEQAITFTLEELIKRIDILMKHELKNALINLNISIDVDILISIKGNVNSLVQVINNMISNSIQAYDGKANQSIEMNITKDKNNIVISIKDFAGGLPKEIKDKLFKEMITTKGKNGTGLGLFMSYSNIRAHFNGNITFNSQDGVGTTFYITLPIMA